MKPPPDKEIFQDELAEYWLESSDLLYSVCTSSPRTAESTKKSFELIEKITGGRKICLISDISAAGQGSGNVREVSITHSQKHFMAMALITSSAFSGLLGNMFLTFSRQPLPVKLFTNEKEAREWINRHLKPDEAAA